MSLYYAIKHDRDLYMNNLNSLACEGNKLYPVERIEQMESEDNEYHITDETGKDHAFTLNYLGQSDSGNLYVSHDMKTWWKFKTDKIYLLDDPVIELGAIETLIGKWSVVRAGEEEGQIDASFKSFEDAIEHGCDVYQEIKREKIQERLNSMLAVIDNGREEVINIHNNFKGRKIGGLLRHEIKELNKIWTQYETKRIGAVH